MALRRAVPKTPPKSPVSPRSPIYKPRFLPNPPESTLPQLLIPFHFNSCIRNVYKKPQGEAPRVHPKFGNSPLATPGSCGPHTNARNPNPLYALRTTLCIPLDGEDGVHSQRDSQTPLHRAGFRAMNPGCRSLAFRGSGTTPRTHGRRPSVSRGQSPGPQVPLRRNPQSARITVVTASRHSGKHIRPRWCLMQEERTSGSASADC
jgi:hypothetical protein